MIKKFHRRIFKHKSDIVQVQAKARKYLKDGLRGAGDVDCGRRGGLFVFLTPYYFPYLVEANGKGIAESAGLYWAFEVFPLNSNVCNFLIEVTFTGEYLSKTTSTFNYKIFCFKLLTELVA